MGNYLKVPEWVSSDKKLLKFFKKCKPTHLVTDHMLEKLMSVFECYDYYQKVYHPRQLLTQDEFDDVFCSLLNDCETYFKLLEDQDSH